MVFISPDRVLPPEQAVIWEGAKREMDSAPARWTLATARKAIKPRLKALLEAHGFVSVKLPPKSQFDVEH
ncbi:hypothetical protein [Variovorax sp. V15]|uniref:hypothetical protein n=1 Tax=Variovorax sp. V15 TaxID=3065952 RepID=UPI0034E8D2D1